MAKPSRIFGKYQMKTEDIKLSVENRAILITGGAGFIGSDFAKLISESNTFKRIYILDSMTYAADVRRISSILEKPNVEFVEANIKDALRYRNILKECSHAVNFAAESHVDRSIESGFDFVESNILGAFTFFEECRNVSDLKLLHVSTDEVYGSLEDGSATEDYPLHPSSAYSSSKASADLLALSNYYTHKQKLVISRCCNNYGHFQNSEKFLPKMISQLLTGKKVPVYGTGENLREWIYVRDHSEALRLILSSGKDGTVYNVGSKNRLSNLELLNRVVKILDVRAECWEFVADRKGHDARYAIDSQKIRTQLGWKDETDFEFGLASTVEWYKTWFREYGKPY
jgi:dTDP-glucose 4,6-dehydratase